MTKVTNPDDLTPEERADYEEFSGQLEGILSAMWELIAKYSEQKCADQLQTKAIVTALSIITADILKTDGIPIEIGHDMLDHAKIGLDAGLIYPVDADTNTNPVPIETDEDGMKVVRLITSTNPFTRH